MDSALFTLLLISLCCYAICSELNETEVVPCYVPNESNNESVWRLVWEDGFDGKNLSESEWDVQHESVFCGGNGIQQVSCNVMHNVHLFDGTVSLWAQRENYYEYLYTAATITTKRFFSHGRWEFRVAQPVGKQLRTTIFTRNDNEAYWHEFGQLDIVSQTGEPIIYRGVHFANSSSNYQPMDFIWSQQMTPMSEFHTVGIEWDDTEVRYLIDGQYSKPIPLDHASKTMFYKHNIRFQIGVGGRLFTKPMPERFELMQWQCPAFIIDYVRIFEKVSLENVTLDQLEQCQSIAINDSKPVLDKVCRKAMELMTNEGETSLAELGKINWLPIAIIILLILFLILLSYLIFQIAKVKRRVRKEIDPMAGGYDLPNEYYENVYDSANVYELELEPGAKKSYLQLQDDGTPPTGNEYLEIKEDYRKSRQPENGGYDFPEERLFPDTGAGTYERLSKRYSSVI